MSKSIGIYSIQLNSHILYSPFLRLDYNGILYDQLPGKIHIHLYNFMLELRKTGSDLFKFKWKEKLCSSTFLCFFSFWYLNFLGFLSNKILYPDVKLFVLFKLIFKGKCARPWKNERLYFNGVISGYLKIVEERLCMTEKFSPLNPNPFGGVFPNWRYESSWQDHTFSREGNIEIIFTFPHERVFCWDY